MEAPWKLVIDETLYKELSNHLFPGDNDEHGAVIAAGIAKGERGTRLLARRLFKAVDGVDFIEGNQSYRELTASFVRSCVKYCRDEQLVYLGIHNHGGSGSVAFSAVDNASHERGYPALLDISGQPVGGLVFAKDAVAGDIWTADRKRRMISETIVVGPAIRRLYPSPPPAPRAADRQYDRQVRWLGNRGQDVLSNMKVAVVGVGGVGLPLATMLSRLGVGHLLVIDPDRIEPENLPRMPEARPSDAATFLRKLPGANSAIARRFIYLFSTKKTRVAKRAVRRANRDHTFTGIAKSVADPDAAKQLTDCDFIFLAADSHVARLIVNSIAHQYLIPVIQMGTRIDVDKNTGAVGEIRTNVKLVLPRSGCLQCNGYIDSSKVAEESVAKAERDRNRYIDEIPAPSVITFNTLAASQGATDFLMMISGLMEDEVEPDYIRFRPRRRHMKHIEPIPGRAACSHCGTAAHSKLARGDAVELPTIER